jgi:hypothetical protein
VLASPSMRSNCGLAGAEICAHSLAMMIQRKNPQNYGTRGGQFFWNRQIMRNGVAMAMWWG